MSNEDVFAVKGNPFFKKTFYSTVLSTNIAVYRYLADILFDGDIGRIVWASNERTFRKRQEQVTKRSTGNNIGTLDLPYCSFRLTQDGLEKGALNRPWFNQALNVRGMWVPELGRKLRVTPVQLRYEGVVCMQHDTDLYWLQQLFVWNVSNEKLLKPVLETISEDNKRQEIQNIAVTTIVPHMNTRFSEVDWLSNNKVQTIDIEIQIDTYILMDNRRGYWLTKSALLEFATNALPHLKFKRHRNGRIEEILNTEIFN
jgi:hypothetical protein